MMPAPETSADPDPPGLHWRLDTGADAEGENARTAKTIGDIVRRGDRDAALAAFDGWGPTEVLSCLVQQRTKHARKLLKWLPEDMGMRVLAELDRRFHVVLFQDETKSKFRKLLASMSPQSALLLLQDLPEEYADELIDAREDCDALRAQLAHEDDTAGSVMRRHALAIPIGWTIGDAIEDIRRRSDQIEKIDSLHVVDADRKLRGYLRIRDLLHYTPETPVARVARPDPITVSADMDREEVLDLARREALTVLAVTDRDGRFLGAITPHELTEIARDEAEEDMLLRAGVQPGATAFDSPLEIVRRRAPWLLIGLMGALVAAVAVGSFEHALTEAAILASFIPVVMATAGNAGMQASTMAIQSMSSGQEWQGDFWPRIAREMAGAALNGALVGIFVILAVALASGVVAIDRPAQLALTAGLALFAVTVAAGTFGAVIPVVLRALGADPAVATGIFIMTAADVFGVLIFFAVATVFYL